MQLFFHIAVIFVCTFITTTDADLDVQICDSKNFTISNTSSIDIMNIRMQTTVEQTTCQCSITSDTYLDIILKVFVFVHHDGHDQIPLEINYEIDGRTHTVNTLNGLQPFLRIAAEDMVVARNASNIIIKLEESGTNKTDVKFLIEIKTFNDMGEQINVNCLALGTLNDTRKYQNEEDENEILEYVEDLCSSSPILVILLAGVCVVLLIIILIVSIILCCVMPRKQREQIKQIRHSMLADTADTTFTLTKTDRIRPEGRLSDNPRKSNVSDNNILDVPFPPDYFNKTYQYQPSDVY